MTKRLFWLSTFILIISYTSKSFSQETVSVYGTIIDKEFNEPLTGATIQINGTTNGAIADIDGHFELNGLKKGEYKFIISYVGYHAQSLDLNVIDNTELSILLEPDNQQLSEVIVVTKMKRNTETALISQQKNSLVVQTGISAQQITKTQDRDASEVIRRVPGISIIDEKFVMVRGLSQRYNNVWINNNAVPSSEADSRAFSFDIIPSSQLDNMLIVKSPAPEFPADFTGGFILINTKDIPEENAFYISIGGSINDQTHFKDFQYSEGSSTDFIGFDNGFRSLQGGINSNLNPIAGNGIDLLNNGFNNDWTVKNKKPLANIGFNTNFSHRHKAKSGNTFAIMGTANYNNSYKTVLNMKNSLFGAYDTTHDKSNYLRKSTDDQYNHFVRVGAMLNLTFVPANGNSRYELKNIFNQLSRDRYTYRRGISAQSDQEESAEYYYTSRTTYNGQFTGKYTLNNESKLDWSAGYAYANRNIPDRKRYLINDAAEEGRLGLSTANDINREFSKLNEHIFSANANYQSDFSINSLTPTLKTGIYSEYRTRDYNTRMFIYNWNASDNNLPSGFRYMNIPNELLQDKYYGADGLYLLEKVKWSNNYGGDNLLAAGYLGVNLPIEMFNVYAGVRFEHNEMKLISNTKDYEKSPKNIYYTYNDLFPSVNTTYKISEKQQIRLSYGRTTNRPEFREVSPSVFYDFDLASNVQGNYNLKSAYIDNADFGYEYYPSNGEIVAISAFYKHFKNPIEWTYTVNGGTDLTYSYVNANAANNYGIEIDIRKNLDFIGLRNLSWNFNGALIKSKVKFEDGSKEQDRPMQGQSPYLINTGFFYQLPTKGWNASVLYNRIGKRIVGVGRSMGSEGDRASIPDSYEMPRNAIDINISKKFNNSIEVKFAVRDLLADKISFKQFEKTDKGEIEQITRQYSPGRDFSLSISYHF